MAIYYVTESFLYEVHARNEDEALDNFQRFMEAGENDNDLDFIAKFLDNETNIREQN